jgi:hypothetical protein
MCVLLILIVRTMFSSPTVHTVEGGEVNPSLQVVCTGASG